MPNRTSEGRPPLFSALSAPTMKLSSVCRCSGTRHKSLQQRCSPSLSGALEAPGDLPGARDPQMAPNARVHTDYDPAQRRVATHAYGWPHRGHPRASSSDVVPDGRSPPILAGSHDSLSIRGLIKLHQQLGGHRHPGHQPVASAPGMFRSGLCGHEHHIVD